MRNAVSTVPVPRSVAEEELSIGTRKQHLAAVRHFFDDLVTRHAMNWIPALSAARRTL
jgi:hypothetical protein